MSTRNPVFTNEPDGSVTVDEFTPALAITRELLETAQPHLLSRTWRTITFHCANATASYRMYGRYRQRSTYQCVRIA